MTRHLAAKCDPKTPRKLPRFSTGYKYNARSDVARQNVGFKFRKQNKINAYISVSDTRVTLPYHTTLINSCIRQYYM